MEPPIIFSRHPKELPVSALPPAAQIMSIMNGDQAFHTIATAVDLNIAGLLEEFGPLPVSKLAQKAQVDTFSLFRILRALASIGIFREQNSEELDYSHAVFEQTDLSRALVPHEQLPENDSVYDTVTLFSAGWQQDSWRKLTDSVRAGKTGLELATGGDIWQYLQNHTREREQFQKTMTWLTQQVETAILQAYDFSPFKQIVDVAGGRGTMLMHILEAYPRAQGILLDLPPIVKLAQQIVQHNPGVSDRYTFVPGSFFDAEAIPQGGHLYYVKQIIQDWNDENAIKILRNIRQSMKPDSRLLIIEQIIERGTGGINNKFFDVLMMVILEGRSRTASEHQRLLEAAGFRLSQVISTHSTYSIIEGIPQE